MTEDQMDAIMELAQECEYQMSEAARFERLTYTRTTRECRQSATYASAEAFRIAQGAE